MGVCFLVSVCRHTVFCFFGFITSFIVLYFSVQLVFNKSLWTLTTLHLGSILTPLQTKRRSAITITQYRPTILLSYTWIPLPTSLSHKMDYKCIYSILMYSILLWEEYLNDNVLTSEHIPDSVLYNVDPSSCTKLNKNRSATISTILQSYRSNKEINQLK